MSGSAARVALGTIVVASAVAMACSRPPRLAADLVITRANVWTGDSARPSAMAVAIIADRIVDVGGADEIEHWRGPNTTVLNAEGRRLIPGFNDAHMRLLDGGTRLDNVDLTDADSQAEFARRIIERAKTKAGEWVLGGDWDEQRWSPAALPTRHLIDEGINAPVFVVHRDGRMALANSAALGRAGITEGTPDPPGGAFVKGADGFPTGVLQGTAMDAVRRVIPATTAEQRQHAVKRALEQAASQGITSVQDLNATADAIATYAELANRGELTARVYAALPERGWYDQARIGIHRAFGSPWLRLGAVSGAIDGSPGAGELRTRLMAADYAGLQLCLQPRTDAGVSQALAFSDDIVRANGGRDRRLRLDGFDGIEAYVDRVVAVGAIVSLHPASAGTTDAFRKLLDGGVRVALGSTWPSAPLNPLASIAAASTMQRATVAEALAAATSGSAFAEFQENEKGTIARGKLADLVILSDDILSIPAAQIKNVKVLTTIVGGKVVHQRKP